MDFDQFDGIWGIFQAEYKPVWCAYLSKLQNIFVNILEYICLLQSKETHMELITGGWSAYLSILQNIFVKILEHICKHFEIYLSTF